MNNNTKGNHSRHQTTERFSSITDTDKLQNTGNQISSSQTNNSTTMDIFNPDKSHFIKPTTRRYFILIMYSICSMEKSFQWINLSSITNKVSFYYGVDNIAVNWTSVLFMITFIPLVLPTGWLIERIGLRKAVLIGSLGITIGAIIKCFSCQQDRFYVVILGQIVVSLSEQFIFCIPARIASVWFPDHQVSLATGIGIFGNQCGIALGFLIPQAILKGLETREQIGQGLYQLFLWTTIVAVVTLIILIFLFEDAPKYAPGQARLRKILEEQTTKNSRLSLKEELKTFGKILVQLISDRNVALLVVAYGVNVGTGYAIQTLLNQFVASANWENSNQMIGTAGMVVITCGMIGALFWGHLCDVTHKYLLINRILYLGAILSMIYFGVSLKLYNELLLYSSCGLLGFFLIGYTVAGLDTVVELTYPTPELYSTSVMNLSPQIFGTAITFIGSAVVDNHDSNAAVTFLTITLVVGLIITMIIREQLCRQKAVEEEQERERLRNGPPLEI